MGTLAQIQQQHRDAVDGMFRDCGATLEKISDDVAAALKAGNKILFCGNGGSACDAMHIAGEFVGRFVNDRKALAAIALTADVGIITAVANDYGYDEVFARQVAALGNKGDILVVLTTSGKSPNVLKAIDVAKEKGLEVVLMTGEKGRGVKVAASHVLVVPSHITAHVQEAHQTALHAMASLVEKRLFS